jgi:hypothetical protein
MTCSMSFGLAQRRIYGKKIYSVPFYVKISLLCMFPFHCITKLSFGDTQENARKYLPFHTKYYLINAIYKDNSLLYCIILEHSHTSPSGRQGPHRAVELLMMMNILLTRKYLPHSFIVHNMNKFCNITYKHDHHFPRANLSCYQKRVYYAGTKLNSALPRCCIFGLYNVKYLQDD